MSDDLVSAATGGTARRAPPAAAFESPAARLAPSDVTVERRVLLAAGAEAVRAQAGALAPRAAPVLSAAAAEQIPPMRGGAADLIRVIIDGHRDDLLAEVVARLRRARCRVPHGILAEWMTALARAKVRGAGDVCGTRGVWLAAIFPEWRAVVEAEDVPLPDDERTWSEGSADDQLRALRRMRAADPSRGRDWVASVWKSERADRRATLLAALERGLAADDEAFLESALDDRSQEVRRAAAELLQRLPESAWVRRMTGYADEIVRVVAGRVEPAIPDPLPHAWERDIVDFDRLRPKPGEAGAKSWTLRNLVASVPVAHWTTRFRAPPAKLISALRKSEWFGEFIFAWTGAAVRAADAVWAAALLAELGRAPEGERLSGKMLELLGALPTAEREAAALAQVERDGDVALLDALDCPWSPSAAAAVIAHLGATAPSKDTDHRSVWVWDSTAELVARSVPASSLSSLAAVVASRDGTDDRASLRRTRETIELRIRIEKEITP